MKKSIYVVMHSCPQFKKVGDRWFDNGYLTKPDAIRAYHKVEDAEAYVESIYKKYGIEFDITLGGYSSDYLSLMGYTDEAYKIKYAIQEVVIS